MEGMQLEFTPENIAVLRMTNGENKINYGFLEKFHSALDEVEKNNSCKALITTGEGKFFSNGFDLEFFMGLQRDPKEVMKWMDTFHSFLARMVTFPMPTVAAINGHAFAGGAYLSVAHDARLMIQERGWMCWSEAHVKIPFTEALYQMAKVRMAVNVRSQALALGRRFTAQEALQMGLADAVSSEAALMKDATALANSLAGKKGLDRGFVALTKSELFHKAVKVARTSLTKLPKL